MAKKANTVAQFQARSKTKTPQDQPLKGMEEARYADCDRACQLIADVRAERNRLNGEEEQLKLQAAKALKKHGLPHYTYAGVELALVPGEEHLRVRLVKDKKASEE